MELDKVFISYFLTSIAIALARGSPSPEGGVSRSYYQSDGGNYQFAYDVEDGYNQQYRQESRDVFGRVVGSYGLTEADGRKRVVDYVADEYGFRANVRTNEPGVTSQEPASVRIEKIDDGVLPPPNNYAPIAPSIPIIPSGQPAYTPASANQPTTRRFDDLHEDSLGTAYTQNYPQVPAEPARLPPTLQNYPQQPLSPKGIHSLGSYPQQPLPPKGIHSLDNYPPLSLLSTRPNLYLNPYHIGSTNPHQTQSSSPGHRGIGLISSTPSLDALSTPRSSVQGVAYYPDPHLRLYYHPYKTDSGSVPSTTPNQSGYKSTDVISPVGEFPVLPESSGSSDKPNIILRAVPIPNGIQAVPVDATTGKVYTGSTGFPTLDMTNKINPIDANRAGIDATDKLFPGVLDPTVFVTPERDHRTTTDFAGPRQLYPSGTPEFRGIGLTSGGAVPISSEHSVPASVYPGSIGPVPKATHGFYPSHLGPSVSTAKLNPGTIVPIASATDRGYPSNIGQPVGPIASTADVTYPRGIQDKIYPGPASHGTRSGIHSDSTVLTADGKGRSIHENVEGLPKFGTRLRPPQSTFYRSQTSDNVPAGISYRGFQRRPVYSSGEPNFAASTENKSTAPSKKEHR